MPDDLPRLMDETEVAAALGLSIDTLRRLIEASEFPAAVPVSEGTRKWFPEDIRAYLYLKGRVGQKKK